MLRNAVSAATGDGGGRRLRRWLRHTATRRRSGVWPFQLLDPTRAFAEAARALVQAAAPGAAPSAFTIVSAAVTRLTGRCPQAHGATRVEVLARALDAYGRDYPHKLLVPLCVLDARALQLDNAKELFGQHDPYIALRDAYLDNRKEDIYDGDPPIDYCATRLSCQSYPV